MTSFIPLRVVGFFAVAVLVLGFLTLAPSSLGGTATWVSTSGISMQPGIHTDDLVVARPRPSYDVGDVVAYPSTTLDGTIVLHRIVAEKPEGFVTQGDNNAWVDPDRPHGSEILGAMWVHIPGGGRMLSIFANPFVIGTLALSLLMLGSLGIGQRSRRRRGSGGGVRRAPRSASAKPSQSIDGKISAEWVAATALGAICLSIFAFGQPTATTAAKDIAFTHSAELGYSAPVDQTGVYSGDKIRTGDPVFLGLAPVLDTHLDYALQGPSARVGGTVLATARVSASNGWERSFTLAPAIDFQTGRTQQSAKVDLRSILRAVHRAEATAGSSFGSYTLDVVYEIHVEGDVAGQPVDTTYRPRLSFALDDVQAIPQGVEPGNHSVVKLSEPGKVVGQDMASATVPVLRWNISVSLLRILGIVLGLTALTLAALWLVGRSARVNSLSIFGDRLVSASNVDVSNRTLVDVDELASLLKLATMYDTVVIEVARSEDQLFLVTVDQTVYRYARPTRPSVDAAGTTSLYASPAERH